MDQKQNIEDIIKTTHPHPSMTEGIQECIRLLLDKSIYKPDVFPEYMHVRTWAPED
jgi:dihydrolipoamide dehydrogenase